MDPIRVVVRRGGVTEAEHLVHAAASRDGRLVASAGNPRLTTFLRSSAKPFQALALARAYDDLHSRELAIASASHRHDRAQLDAVRMLLSRAHATEADLECGTEGDPPAKLNDNSSGKHAGMLAVCGAHVPPPLPSVAVRFSSRWRPAARATSSRFRRCIRCPGSR